MNARTVTRDFFGARLKEQVNAVFLQNLGHGRSDVRIFLSEQTCTRLNNGDFASQSTEELAKLKTNVTTAENHQMFRNEVQLHDGSACKKRDVLETGDLRNGGTAPGVDEETISSEDAVLTL